MLNALRFTNFKSWAKADLDCLGDYPQNVVAGHPESAEAECWNVRAIG